jgi:oligopeptide/dipeptide ABC transporter ATP-binding protein
MIFQEPRRSLDPAFTVGDQIAETARRHLGLSRRAATQRAAAMLDRVGIPDAAKRAREYPHMFSGGMCQRVMIALALVTSPKLLIADEPTTALDPTVQARVLELLRDLQEQFGLAIVFITHDLGVVAEMSDELAVMYAGQVVEQGTTAEIFRRPLHPYTEGLLKSLPQQQGHRDRLVSIRGTVPSPFEWTSGCRFAPRCDYADVGCQENAPEVVTLGERRHRCRRAADVTLVGLP